MIMIITHFPAAQKENTNPEMKNQRLKYASLIWSSVDNS